MKRTHAQTQSPVVDSIGDRDTARETPCGHFLSSTDPSPPYYLISSSFFNMVCILRRLDNRTGMDGLYWDLFESERLGSDLIDLLISRATQFECGRCKQREPHGLCRRRLGSLFYRAGPTAKSGVEIPNLPDEDDQGRRQNAGLWNQNQFQEPGELALPGGGDCRGQDDMLSPSEMDHPALDTTSERLLDYGIGPDMLTGDT